MAFHDETIDVLIGGYMSKDAARDDYEAVLASGGYLHGAVVVSKDLQGSNVSVEQTDHMVREVRGGPGRGRVRGRAVCPAAARHPVCSPRLPMVHVSRFYHPGHLPLPSCGTASARAGCARAGPSGAWADLPDAANRFPGNAGDRRRSQVTIR